MAWLIFFDLIEQLNGLVIQLGIISTVNYCFQNCINENSKIWNSKTLKRSIRWSKLHPVFASADFIVQNIWKFSTHLLHCKPYVQFMTTPIDSGVKSSVTWHYQRYTLYFHVCMRLYMPSYQYCHSHIKDINQSAFRPISSSWFTNQSRYQAGPSRSFISLICFFLLQLQRSILCQGWAHRLGHSVDVVLVVMQRGQHARRVHVLHVSVVAVAIAVHVCQRTFRGTERREWEKESQPSQQRKNIYFVLQSLAWLQKIQVSFS